MSKIMSKISGAFKKIVFGEESQQPKGGIYIVTPCSRVKFEADLTVKDDFDRAIFLLENEKKIVFPD